MRGRLHGEAFAASERACEFLEHTAATIDNTWKLRIIDCPKCTKPLVFCRNGTPHMDACGFESYLLDCGRCNGVLVGVVDPYDEGLLVSMSTGALKRKPHH